MLETDELAKKLSGTWELVEFIMELANGETAHPLGKAAVGRLVYTENGFMSAHLMPGGDLPEETASKLTPEVSALSYCGGYRVQGDQILHDVDIGSRPGWTGTTRLRFAAFDADELLLKTDGSHYGDLEGIGILRWRRMR